MIVEKTAGDLRNYLQTQLNNPNIDYILLSIMIQICYSLLLFNKIFGKFAHNDLHAGNILYTPEIDHPIEKNYEVKFQSSKSKMKFKLKNLDICPKIWDFDDAYIKSIDDILLRRINGENTQEDNIFYEKYFNYLGSNENPKLFKIIDKLMMGIDFDLIILIKDILRSIMNNENIIRLSKIDGTFINLLNMFIKINDFDLTIKSENGILVERMLVTMINLLPLEDRKQCYFTSRSSRKYDEFNNGRTNFILEI